MTEHGGHAERHQRVLVQLKDSTGSSKPAWGSSVLTSRVIDNSHAVKVH